MQNKINHSICHLTSVHHRFDSRIFWKECTSLAAAGYDVSLVVADGGRDEVQNGVVIFGVPKMNGRLRRMFRSTRFVLQKAREIDADLYHLHDPELLLIAGALLRDGKQVVFDSHEDLPRQILLKQYLPSILRKSISFAYEKYELWMVSRLSGVVAVTPELARRYLHRQVNSVSVENYVDTGRFTARPRNFDAIRVIHAGALTGDRGIHAMVELAKKLKDGDSIRLAGPMERGLKSEHLTPAKYLGVLGANELLGEYAAANVGLILYRPVGQYGLATAVKLYEYMASGIPVIVPNHGNWPNLISEIGNGFCVDVDDIDAQLAILEWYRANPSAASEMGLRGREYVSKCASWNGAFRRLLGLYERIFQNG